MQKLGSFLQDTKHTLQVIEEINERIDKGEVNLDGVALVGLDVENMYNNMSLELGTGASKEFLEKRQSIPSDGGDNFVSTQSLLSGNDLLMMC